MDVDVVIRVLPEDFPEFLEDRVSGGVLQDGPEGDEILVQEGFELGVVVELLTEQFASPSGIGREVDQNPLVFGLGLGHGLIEGPLEKDLGRCR